MSIKPIQESLPLPEKAREEVPLQIISSCRTLSSTVRLMITSSGYSEDQVGCALGYSTSHWSEILNGKKNLPWEKNGEGKGGLKEAMDFCASDLPLRWLALSRGYGLFRLKSEVELENERLKAELSAQEAKLATIMEFMQKVKGV